MPPEYRKDGVFDSFQVIDLSLASLRITLMVIYVMVIYVLHYRFQHRHLDSPRVLFFFCIDDCIFHMNSTFVTCSFLGEIGVNSIQHFICCYCLDHCPVIDHLHWATPWSEWYRTVRPFPCYSSLTLIDSDTKYNGFNSNAWGMVTFTNFCTDPCLKALPNVVYISVFQFCWQEYRRLTCGHLI